MSFSKRSLSKLLIWTAILISLSAPSTSQNLTNCSNSTSTAGTNYSQCLDDELAYESCPDPSLCEITNTGDNVGLAFGLTIGAGLSTTLGALLPFIPFIKRSNTRYLAAGLALAAGVMLYVSFTEIWIKAKDNFCCELPTHYDLVTTACFFGGILITVLLDILVSLLQRVDCGCRLACLTSCCRRKSGDKLTDRLSFTNRLKRSSIGFILPASSSPQSSERSGSLQEGSEVDIELGCMADGNHDNHVTPSSEANEDAVSHGPSIGTCTSVLPSNNDHPISEPLATTPECVSMSVQSNNVSESTNNYGGASVNELFSNSSLLRMNEVIPEKDVAVDSAIDVCVDGGSQTNSNSVGSGIRDVKDTGLVRRHSYLEMVDQVHESFEPQGPEEFKEVTEGLGKDAKKLQRMGILTGLAIAIHNFPEGLATFVATLADPSLGVALCIAIAFHNIPEGVCVAMPVYYATGKRWKGFLWAFLSGVSEPLGALLGWLVLKDVFGPLVYGIAFGLISGMMVFISLKELLPTARKFDTTGGVLVNVFLVTGMVIMAVSLILFLY